MHQKPIRPKRVIATGLLLAAVLSLPAQPPSSLRDTAQQLFHLKDTEQQRIGLRDMTIDVKDTGQKSIGLREAIDLALKNSKELRVSKAKTAEAEASLKEAQLGQLPDLKVSGSYLRLTQPNIDIDPNVQKAIGGGSGSGSGSGGTGGGGTSGGSGGGSSSATNIKVNEAMYGIANLSLPLFAGFRVRYGIESARYLLKAAQLDAGNDRETVVLNAISAYANLYKAHENVLLLQENLAQSRQRDFDLGNMEKNGLLARNDLLKAQLQTSNVEYSLADAQRNEKMATVNMNLLLGLPEQSGLLTDSNALLQQGTLEPIETYEKEALERRGDRAAMKYRTSAAAASVQSARSAYYPTVALTGGYVAAKIPGFFTVTNAVTYGLGLQYNLSFWKTGQQIVQQKVRQEQASANEALQEDQIRLQVNQAYQDYLTALKKIDLGRKAVEQGTENLRITRNKYKNTLVTTTDLLEADVSLLQASINLEVAKADAMVAFHTLLERSGVLTETILK